MSRKQKRLSLIEAKYRDQHGGEEPPVGYLGKKDRANRGKRRSGSGKRLQQSSVR